MIKTQNFVVDFHHTQDENIIQALNPPRVMPKAATKCAIFFKTQGGEVSTSPMVEAAAFCTQNDQFVKATGRKIALRKALVSLNRDARTEIWSGYLAACKPVKKTK